MLAICNCDKCGKQLKKITSQVVSISLSLEAFKPGKSIGRDNPIFKKLLFCSIDCLTEYVGDGVSVKKECRDLLSKL
jgi:hypothetical protein